MCFSSVPAPPPSYILVTVMEDNTINTLNGSLKGLSIEQVREMYDHTGGRLKGRKIYLKLACLAVLKYQSNGRPLSARQVRELGDKYIPNGQGWSNQVVGSVLGMLSRMGLIDRSYDKPHTYWWKHEF